MDEFFHDSRHVLKGGGADAPVPTAFAFAGAFTGERVAAVPHTGGGRVDLIPHVVGDGSQFGMLRQHPFDGLLVTGAFALRHRLQIEQICR